MKKFCLLLGIICGLISLDLVLPTTTHSKLTFLVNTEKPCLPKSKQNIFLENAENLCSTKIKRQINGGNSAGIKVSELKIRSNINNRFANTVVTTKVANSASTAEKHIFSVIIPSDTFVVDFVMELGGQNYTAFVVDDEEARKQFDSTLAEGLPGGYVVPSTRDSNIFIITISVEPNSEAILHLTYQELLTRKHGRYEHIVNIHPGEPVKDLTVEVFIDERRKIKDLKAPPLRTGNQIGNGNMNLKPHANIKLTSDSSAVITFSPDIERQKQFALLLNTPEENGLACQFVIQYDVERDSSGGEMLVKNCFFVNFFAPVGLEPISKYIVFVLDTSASMDGDKIQQLQEAMGKILDQLHEKDIFYLVEFSTGAKVWNLDNSTNNFLYSAGQNNSNFPNGYPANSNYIKRAKSSVNQFYASGGTDAQSGLDLGLTLVETARQEKVDKIDRPAVIVFLTDGAPNTSPEGIITAITQLNAGLKKSSIFSFSFGKDANKDFVQKLSLMNGGTAKHIYESNDSAKQLETFYDEISSPVLLNITVNYNPSQVKNVTKTHFPVLYYGSEIVVAGKCGASKVVDPPVISATSSNGPVRRKPVVKNSLTDISRLWAYLTVKELLDQKKMSNINTNAIDKEIVDLSLKNSFVTGLSTMVVTTPLKDVVVGKKELEGSPGTQSYSRASAPVTNYARPTTATTPKPTTTTTTTTKTPKPITPLAVVASADVKVLSKILINLSILGIILLSYCSK